MELFKYVGGRPKLGVTLKGVPPVSPAEFHQQQVKTFERVYREQIGQAIRRSGGLFKRSHYKDLPSQHKAFDRLLEFIEAHRYQLLEVVKVPHASDEFHCQAKILIPTEPIYDEQLFAGGVPNGHRGFVIVSFFFGLLEEHTRLIRNTLETPDFDAYTQLKEFQDKSFDPEVVIPGVLKNLRADRRYLVTGLLKPLVYDNYYQTPEGIIYRVEIDGYATQAP